MLENGDEPVEEITITYLKMTPFITAKYLIERDTFLAGEEVMMTYRLERVSDEMTRISSDMQVSGLPIRHAVERFFDDVLGDELDSFATMTSCKRSWRLRKENDVDLTSEMGSGYVQLHLSGNTENRDNIEQGTADTTRRMSA